ncbi:hypothetical protein [Lentzea cavernae]|uniref:Uncharacterized protein n=1 Tax=Lentzea cavernae TaxID=2020703 RepID=A0ABQ3MMI2_9PSEU|nr:hypothetical protein [Lentzea cavernae]GHH50831.1 hypothetical protein GCM10017774_60520 [Lentzea cavernae]
MNEQDLKRAFEDVVVASSPRPSMDPRVALDRAHKARSRRRASVTGAVVAVLVVGVGLGSAFALNPQGTKEYVLGAGPSSSHRGVPDPEWGEQWPVGQNDRTATNGPQADRGKQLLELARASVPAGYDAPDLQYKTPGMAGGMLRGQAQIITNKGETPQVWEYTASVPVRKGDKVGRLTVRVSTPNPKAPTDPCAQVNGYLGNSGAGGCKTYDVAGNQVATAASMTSGPASTWASYRAANGWTVTVGQAEEYSDSGYPKLDSQPFFTPALAELAADPKFLLGS